MAHPIIYCQWPLRGDGDQYTLFSWEGVETNNRQTLQSISLVAVCYSHSYRHTLTSWSVIWSSNLLRHIDTSSLDTRFVHEELHMLFKSYSIISSCSVHKHGDEVGLPSLLDWLAFLLIYNTGDVASSWPSRSILPPATMRCRVCIRDDSFTTAVDAPTLSTHLPCLCSSVHDFLSPLTYWQRYR
jgi:hypothetical protein